ncbi:hypothetical protein [Tessaracoccus sp.]
MPVLGRRRTQLRLVGVLLAAAVSSVVVRTASTPVGLEADAIMAASGATRGVTSVQIEWNREALESPWPVSLRVIAQSDQMLEAGDVVDVTAVGAGTNTCSAMTTMITRSSAVDLQFPACGILLWDVQSVRVHVSGQGSGAALKSTAGIRLVSLASFHGPVVQRGAAVKSSHSTSVQAGVETLTTLRLSMGGATADQLVGKHLVSILSTANEVPTTFTGTVGTSVNNKGIWVEKDSTTATPVVIVDLSRLTGGKAPKVIDSTQYRLMLLQPQHLGDGQTPDTSHALITAAGTIGD